MSNAGSVTVRAPGKVNVQLVVGGRRTDGFHELANVFMAVSSYDDITVSPADRLRITVSGPGKERVPTNDSNLAAQAATLLGKHAGVEPGVHIHIDKRLPVAGGMAGGSADAAGALVACDALWGLGTEQHVLMSLAAELGSDVPFNLLGGTALGIGRGESLTRLPCPRTCHWVFAIAGFGLSTPEVYGAHERRRREAGLPFAAADMPTPQPSAALLEALAQGDTAGLAASISNDLEATATALRPELTRTLKAGQAAGALAGMLCGTGATMAFLATDRPEAERIAERLLASEACASAFVADGPVPGPTLA
ncbi:4-(cytidine 5'-diphospho)-2-C-methyl-D-erythritol kinase [Streptomyces antioxidans]|uniref:4-diphosphocytidyl-2-C-methyl-D-erythritol kinase n=1 Tax=Streptomyces antioxidans TaxID=1507734 RepID=A0A1V4CY25_9ACTN|nr:4-(cytidine 5'-diphospho)-2-C-methyl-D-erythritol kinase [Streptomyces antioxidans]OPF73164.1 4-(cytidine 5'-diphospho)-2-C-methyl-D-erythritol kinase [Streptomyces antioxidans]